MNVYTYIYTNVPEWNRKIRSVTREKKTHITFFSFNFYCSSITVVCLFSPSLHPTPGEPTSLPHPNPPPWFCPCVLYSSSWKPISPLTPPRSPLVIFCLLFSSVDYVPVKGEIIWYLSLTTWLISLNIMLSSSIHAVAKGIRSFLFSAV